MALSKRLIVGLCAAGLTLPFFTVAEAQQLIYLGDLGNHSDSANVANGVNDLDQVVGSSGSTDGHSYAFLYSNGVMINLGVIGTGGTVYSIARGINNSGQVVGESSTAGFPHAFLYSGGAMHDLGSLGGASGHSYAFAINSLGQVVGYFTSGNDTIYGDPFLYSGGVMKDLGLPATPGYFEAFATGINGSGQIVGYADAYPNQGNVSPTVFSYKNGALSLNNLLGQGGEARGCDDSGQIVGYAPSSGQDSAFLYSGGITYNLGIPSGPAGYVQSVANAINASGEIVGSATTSGGHLTHAFLFSTTSTPKDLNTLYAPLLVSGTNSQKGFTALNLANGINSKGDIVGQGTYWSGSGSYPAAFLLLAGASQSSALDTPALPSWALAVLGVLLIGVAARLLPEAHGPPDASRIPKWSRCNSVKASLKNGVDSQVAFGRLPNPP